MKEPQYREGATAFMRKFYLMNDLSQEAVDTEFQRTLYDLKGQLEIMGSQDGGQSTLGS